MLSSARSQGVERWFRGVSDLQHFLKNRALIRVPKQHFGGININTSRHTHDEHLLEFEFLIVCFDIIVLISLILQMLYALYYRTLRFVFAVDVLVSICEDSSAH